MTTEFIRICLSLIFSVISMRISFLLTSIWTMIRLTFLLKHEELDQVREELESRLREKLRETMIVMLILKTCILMLILL
nr:putative P' protein [Colocasia bobone disease-associated virus]